MSKSLTKVGNSQAVIIPRAMINKYKLGAIKLIEKEEGILIVPDREQVSFSEKVEKIRQQKAEIYRKMEKQSQDSETLDYYENQSLSDVDVDILD